MRKLLTLILVVLTAFTLIFAVSCGDNKDNGGDTGASEDIFSTSTVVGDYFAF